MKTFYRVILWTWCLPQTLLGVLVYAFVKLVDKDIEEFDYKTGTKLIQTEKLKAGVSLGFFIFSFDYEDVGRISPGAQYRMDRHEWGHTLQGFLLGPLYLFVIGLPSICWLVFGKSYRSKKKVSYYSFYTEKWADKWGRVER